MSHDLKLKSNEGTMMDPGYNDGLCASGHRNQREEVEMAAREGTPVVINRIEMLLNPIEMCVEIVWA